MERSNPFSTRFKKREVASKWMLTLSAIPLIGISFTLGWGLRNGSPVDGKPFYHRQFGIDNNHVFNNLLTVIGFYNSVLAYCLSRVGVRIATGIRTRAYLNGVNLSELLNSLPESPEWKQFLKPNTPLWILLSGFVAVLASSIGGILYKQGLDLTTAGNFTTQALPFRYVSTCNHPPLTRCNSTKVVQYGLACSAALYGGESTTGIETTSGGRRLTFVGSPVIPPNSGILELRANSIAMVTDYRNVSLPRDFDPKSYDQTGEAGTRLNAHDVYDLIPAPNSDFDWYIDKVSDEEVLERVGGKSIFCLAECMWRNSGNQLRLEHCTTPSQNCSSVDIGFWANPSHMRHYKLDFGMFIYSDQRDRMEFLPPPERNLLGSMFVLPAIFAVVASGGYVDEGESWGKLGKINVFKTIIGQKEIVTTAIEEVKVIESNVYFVVYIALNLLTFVMLWVVGFFDTKVYITAWAPTWFAAIPKDQQDEIRVQVRKSRGLKGIRDKFEEYESLVEHGGSR